MASTRFYIGCLLYAILAACIVYSIPRDDPQENPCEHLSFRERMQVFDEMYPHLRDTYDESLVRARAAEFARMCR